MNSLLKFWRGELGLGITFWAFGFIMQFVLIVAEYASLHFSPEAHTRAFLVSLVYYCIFSVALWRATKAYDEDPTHVRLARAALFLGWLRYLWVAFS